MKYEYYNRACELLAKAGISDSDVQRLEHEFGYFSAPASKSHHLNTIGGLARHSINVTERLLELTEKLGIEWPREESPYLIGMLHDLVKTEVYQPHTVENGQFKYKYVAPVFGGPGSASAILIMARLGIRLLPVEAAAIVWHMGAFNLSKEGLNEYDRALDEFSLAIIATHTADILAARVDEKEVENA